MSSRKRHLKSVYISPSTPNYDFGNNSSTFQNYNEVRPLQDYSNSSIITNRDKSPTIRGHGRQDSHKRSKERSPRRHRGGSFDRDGNSRIRRSTSRSRGFQNRSRGRPRFEPPERSQESRRKRSTSFDSKRHRVDRGNRKDDNRFSPPPEVEDRNNRSGYGIQSKSAFYSSNLPEEIHNDQDMIMNDEGRLIGALEVDNLPKNQIYSSSEHYSQIENQKFSQNFGNSIDIGSTNNNFASGSFSTNETQSNNEKDVPLIPDFNPETSKLSSQQWIDLIEETSQKMGWKKDEKQYIMTSRLGGFASQWYITTGVNHKSWESLKKAFLNSFPTQLDYHELLKNMMARVKDKSETISQYFNHKIALLNTCEIYGSKAVSCIIGGLSNLQIRRDAFNQNFQEPDSLYGYLRANYKEEYAENIKTHNKKCLICGVKGHLQANCPSAAIPDNVKGRGSSNVIEEYTEVQFELPSPECFTDVYINDILINGYIDRSSFSTTIKEETAAELKLMFNRHYKVIRGSRGAFVSSIGFMDIPLSVDRAYAKVTIYVVPNKIQPVPVIIGKSFLEQRHIYVLNGEDKMRVYQRMDNGGINFDF